MTDKQPEALRLADRLSTGIIDREGADTLAAAAELRRLHEVNAELVEALRFYAKTKIYESNLINDGLGYFDETGLDILFDSGCIAREALAKAQGENND